MTADNHFLKLALTTVFRALGQCNRAKESTTFGCCDRAYWHYSTNDLPNARSQEIGLLLALAYNIQAKNNPFYGNPAIKEWIRQIWRYWLSIRNSDGSLNEVYPFERSFCATSFTASAFTETVYLMGERAAWEDELRQSRNTFIWLGQNSNPAVGNQMAASLLALYDYTDLTNDHSIKTLATIRNRELLESQLEDGTFQEYGGLDIGYQTITLSTLSRILIRHADAKIKKSCVKGTKVLNGKIAHDGQCDAASNSRNTQFIYPYGLAYLKSPLLGNISRGLERNTILNPLWMDDRYCIALAIDYFMTYRELCNANDAE